MATDTSYHPVPATSAQAIVTAVTANPSCVVVAGGGVKDTIQVAVLPQAFAGALSSATPKGGDTLTITSTTLLKFDTSKVAVSFAGAGTGSAGVIVSKTPDVVKVLVPGAQPIDFGVRWPHVGGERLYAAPARMGYHQVATRPADLNLFPHPFP